MSESNPITDTVVSKLVTEDTSSTSLVVGGSGAGATTGSGGINCGTLVGNTSVSDPVGTMAALRAGTQSFAGQAAGDQSYAFSATQWAVLAVGGPLTVMRNNATATAYERAATPVRYTATLANVLNSAANTVTASFSVPANLMADGDVIQIQIAALLKNNKGSPGSPQWQVLWGSTASVQVTVGTAWANSATEFRVFASFMLQRVGADVWVYSPGGGTTATGADNMPLMMPWVWGTTAGGQQESILISAPTFNSAQTVSIKLQLDAADSTYYFKPQSALVQHQR